jgi:DNA repair exonuclease SbcCD ATPase subunit
MDPRVEAAGVTAAEVKQQVELLEAIRDRLSETYRFEAALEEEIKMLKAKKPQSKSEESRLAALEKVLSEVQTEEGIYMQPMLSDQWRYLYSLMDQADQLPGRDATERFAELQARLQALKSEAGLD